MVIFINIEELIKMGPISLLPIIVVFLSFGINNYNAQNVELKLMTNIKRISIFLYHLSVTIIIITIVLELSLISAKGIDLNNPVELLGSIIASLFVAIGITVITFFVILTVVKLMGYKNSFYIHESSTPDQNRWYIIRRVDSSRILLSDNVNSYRFLKFDELMDVTIKREVGQLKVIPSKIEKVITENKIFIYFLISLLLLVSIASIEIFESGIWYYVSYFLLLIVIIILIAFITITTDI